MSNEHRAPERIEPRSLADYLEVMSKAVFQTGMSWKVVENKWPSIREAFRGFDPAAVAALTPDDLDALTRDPRVIRNRRKIEATVDNAHQMLELERQHGTPSTGSGQGFRAYLRSHDGFEGTRQRGGPLLRGLVRLPRPHAHPLAPTQVAARFRPPHGRGPPAWAPRTLTPVRLRRSHP
jgi:hypothetical protein